MQAFYKLDGANSQAVSFDVIPLDNGSSYFGIVDIKSSEDIQNKFDLAETIKSAESYNRSVTFEAKEGGDLLGLYLLNFKSLNSHNDRVFICIRKNFLLFICKDAASTAKLFGDNLGETLKTIPFDRILSTFLERMISKDVAFHENIEQEIQNLENALLTSKKRNCVHEIVSLRKRLMALKRYYEQMINVMDEVLQNDNGALASESLRYLRVFTNRTERLYHSVLNLRDYVTQVREAYQAEVDISLNNIMKIFTVITAIFLPLTLIVGWYGMNLKMPEYTWSFGYPMVIILSAAVLVFCLIYFKKNKWF